MMTMEKVFVTAMCCFILSCYDFSTEPVIENIDDFSEIECIYDEVIIEGKFFGSSPGEGGVFIKTATQEKELIVESLNDWNDRSIQALIPFDMEGDEGEVFVRTEEGESNHVDITIGKPTISGTTENTCAGNDLLLNVSCFGSSDVDVEVQDNGSSLEYSLGEDDEEPSIVITTDENTQHLNIKIVIERNLETVESNTLEIEIPGTIKPFPYNQPASFHLDNDGTKHFIYNEGDGNIKHTYEASDGCWTWPDTVYTLNSDQEFKAFSFEDGHLHITFGTGEESTCWHKMYSTSLGQWSEKVIISTLECRTAPYLTKDPGGDLIAYWTWGSTKYVRYHTDSGTWDTTTRAIYWEGGENCTVYPLDGGCIAWYPKLTFGPDGILYAIFGRGTFEDSQTELRLTRSRDGGLSWESINPIDARTRPGRLAVDENNLLHLVYAKYFASDESYALVYKTSNDFGQHWMQQRVFEETRTDHFFSGDVAVSPQGDYVTVRWHEESSSDLLVYFWNDYAGWLDNPVVMQFVCEDGTRNPFYILDPPSDGLITYAATADPGLYGSFAFMGSIDYDVLKQDMVFVPGGCMTMGSVEGEGGSQEMPKHDLLIPAFYIDKYEVTNEQYRACVEDGACSVPASKSSRMRPNYYEGEGFDTYPMINVTWQQARDYCEWAGKRLPTEAEWEKAAAGSKGSKWPWGSECDREAHDGCDLLCSWANGYFSNEESCPGIVPPDCACVGDTERVNIYPDGMSPVGAYNMAGNVTEWVSDYYDPDYYGVSPSINPQGPEDGTTKVAKGGSYFSNEEAVRTARRYYYNPDEYTDVLGFRCAKSAF